MIAVQEWTGHHQLVLLLQSGAFGVCLGFVFDFFNIPSKMHRRRYAAVFLSDVLFFVLASVATFFFSLAVMDGRMHPLLFCGALLGMILQHLLIGRLFSRFLYCTARLLCKMIGRLFFWICVPFRLVFSAIFRAYSTMWRKLEKNARKTQKKLCFFQKNS